MNPIITFLTDFGLEDEWVGICKGVILSIAPDAKIIDITHQIPNFDIKKGAFVLSSSLPFMPIGIHLAVVDPGVGTRRRAIILQAGRGDYLVGPDNGLLIPASYKLGGVQNAVEINNERYFLQPVSQTFHARDIFAPVSAHLARGVEMGDFGSIIDITTLVESPWTAPVIKKHKIEAEVIDIDKFGTVRLNLPADDISNLGIIFGDIVEVKWGSRREEVPFKETFGEAEPGNPILVIDSSGYISLAINQGNAQQEFDLEVGERLDLEKLD